MQTLTQDTAAVFGGSFARLQRRALRRLLVLLGRSRAAIARELQIRRGIAELESLDDRMLHDIGLTRRDIHFAARGYDPLADRRV